MDNITTTFKNKDCIIALQELIDDGVQVDSVITDPPYELGFMGKSWDSTGITYQTEVWELVFKVLKPGGHLLSFGGSRTYHRMAVAIEDAGFEIRDQIMWLYGSGFPKSHNIGKAIDKKAGAKRKVVATEKTPYKVDGKATEGVSLQGSVNGDFCKQQDEEGYRINVITAPETDEAKQWEGWGTALKPAHEPIVMARKPLSEKTVAENVLKHGTGGINIDGCRVGNDGGSGRFPANIIHDGSEEVVGGFPDTKSSKLKTGHKQGTGFLKRTGGGKIISNYGGDSGSAARFFYCAKASKKERDRNLNTFKDSQSGSYNFRVDGSLDGNKTNPRKNIHPTVKPIALMKYLCRLVTPKNGTVLDPFMGSGSTGIAAKEENYNFIGIELNKEYYDIAIARINLKHEQPTQQQLPLQDPELNDYFGSC